LFSAVKDLIDDNLFDPRANNHDLYGGVGLLAAAVADKDPATKIISVESDAVAVDYASKNLSFAPHARSVEGRVDKYLKQTRDNGGKLTGATIVMDPPRVGAGRETMENLTAMKPSQIIYVACDPVALARDVDYAIQSGYQLAEISGFDLFPNTHHFEAIARLTL
jgi:tRNA/tmRNA/rRNA uracil-C5-methylase (TrmA/RlmC/RlmD family)